MPGPGPGAGLGRVPGRAVPPSDYLALSRPFIQKLTRRPLRSCWAALCCRLLACSPTVVVAAPIVNVHGTSTVDSLHRGAWIKVWKEKALGYLNLNHAQAPLFLCDRETTTANLHTLCGGRYSHNKKPNFGQMEPNIGHTCFYLQNQSF